MYFIALFVALAEATSSVNTSGACIRVKRAADAGYAAAMKYANDPKMLLAEHFVNLEDTKVRKLKTETITKLLALDLFATARNLISLAKSTTRVAVVAAYTQDRYHTDPLVTSSINNKLMRKLSIAHAKVKDVAC